ncbi:esterase 6-like isoform X2 [Cydia pomonella]|uniref:esterase 6-like isoform X2 n=1 Tax=Cydia pomonella TaxID=82600 RepID=UPI002ADE40D2|nr:esterase 6-like isoform X2 [Cydia pomonella]
MFNAVQVINQVVFFLVIISVQSSQASVPETLLDSESSRPIVHTPVGCFRGLRAQDGDYSMFLGIPYARVDPENVFGTPIPVRFEGIFEANDDTAICPQKEEFNKTITGKLDCLHINIYVPNSASVDHPVPVMTHIFGGKFEFGFPSRNPTPKPSKLIPLQWPRVSQDKLPYLEINTELRLGSRPMHERMSFLDLLYKHIGRYHKEHLWIEH